MPQPQTQGDIVKQFLMRQEKGTEATDRMMLPGLKHRISMPMGKRVVQTDSVIIPDLRGLAVGAREDIAKTLVGLLNYKPGVVGFNWKVGSNSIEVDYVDGFIREGIPEDELEALVELLVIVLKSRNNITRLKWEFGSDAIEVSFIV